MRPTAIRYVTEAQPGGMQWMTFADAAAVGIEVVPLVPEASQRIDPPPPERSPTRDNWASYGEWIQIYSRESLNEAIELGMAYRREFPGTFVFRYDNGWYVVALGPYDRGAASRERNRLVATRRIPSDSLVNQGRRFGDLVWGAEPERPSVATRRGDDATALAATEDYFRTWSGENRQALAFLQRTYAPQIEYFGKPTSRTQVMREKAEFVARWPVRSYVLQPGTLVRCSASRVCVVEGLVDWRAHSPARRATSTGTASFSLSFSLRGDAPVLAAEKSAVLSRQSRNGN